MDSPETVQLWLIHLDRSPSEVAAAMADLSDDERERAARFRDPLHGARYAYCRSMLRRLLGRALGHEPRELAFSYSPYGKPELANLASPKLHFNVTHSHDLAIIGMRRGVPLGVDIERFRADFATDEIAERFFSSGELAQLRSLPPAERVAGFFRCWSRKEAFIKAVGEGLSFPLDEFEVSIAPTAELRSVRGSAAAAREWVLTDLACPIGYAAALATPVPINQLLLREAGESERF